jgi:HK97 family phage portal protein
MFNNKVVGLKTIDPRTLSIITDSIGQPLRYIQRVGGCVVGFEVNEIIHIKEGQDVDISIFGKSPIEGVFLEAKTDEEVEVSNYALNKNKMSPSNIFTLKEGLSAEAQERALDVIQATLKGSENTGRSISLPEIDKVIQMRLTNSEMQVLEFRKFSTEKICSALGLSKFLLGYTDGVNNNNGVELREGAYIDTIEPTEDTISSALTRQLFFPLFGIQFEAIEQDIGVKQRHEIGIRELERGAITRIEYREKMSYDVDKKDKKGGEYREV